MKKYILSFIVFHFALLTCFAQSNQRMLVKHVDGTVQTTDVEEIEEISFVEVDGITIDLNVTTTSSASIKVYCQKPANCSKYAMMIFDFRQDYSIDICKQMVADGKAQICEKSTEVSFSGLKPCYTYNIVALAYDEYGVPSSISSIQASTNDEAAFTIEVDDITWKDAHVTIIPADQTMTYYCGVMRIEKVNNELGGDVNNIVEFDYAWWDYVASVYGCDVNTVIQNDLVSGTHEFRTADEEGNNSFKWGSQGVVYCYGVDADGGVSTSFTYKIIDTKSPVPSDMTFDITIDELRPRTVHATIIPSDKEATYYVNAQQPSYVNYYKNLDQLDEMCFMLIKDDPTLIGIQQGDFIVDENLFPALRENKDYQLIIFGFKEGKTTDVTLVDFKSLKTGNSSQQSFEYYFLNAEATDIDETCMAKIEDGVYSYQVSYPAEVLSTWATLTGHNIDNAGADYCYKYNSYDALNLQYEIIGHKTANEEGVYAEMTVSNPTYPFIKKIVFIK